MIIWRLLFEQNTREVEMKGEVEEKGGNYILLTQWFSLIIAKWMILVSYVWMKPKVTFRTRTHV